MPTVDDRSSQQKPYLCFQMPVADQQLVERNNFHVDWDRKDLRDAVKLPPDEDPREWIAYNLEGMHKDICMLFGTIKEYCAKSCPKMTAGTFEYVWTVQSGERIKYNASQYISHLLHWVEEQVKDDNIFPWSSPNKEFPPDFMDISKNICRRLVRVFAHCIHHHLHKMVELQQDKIFNTNLKHFIYFTTEFNLLEERDKQPLKKYISKILI